MKRRGIVIVAVGVAAVLAPAASASGSFMRDRLIGSDSARSAGLQGTTHLYRTADGVQIPITIADSFTGDPAVAQRYADFLGSLPHGAELAALRVTIVPGTEVNADCGGRETDRFLACYSPTRQRMVVPGDLPTTAGGLTATYVIAHEYGHHVALHRSNAPLSALDYGPKRWASHELVCVKALDGELFPGAQSPERYTRDPGESWAEVYARLTFPGQRWRFTPLLAPDAGALAAARADVLDPWSGPRTLRMRGRFTARGTRRRTFAVALHLDGAFRVLLAGPRRADYDLRVVSRGRMRAQTSRPGSRDRVSLPLFCRRQTVQRVTLIVQRRSGTGPFSLLVRYAG